MSDNMDRIMQCSANVSLMAKLIGQYEAAKIILADNEEIEIPAGKITALKQKFVTLRNNTKTLLDEITG